MELKQLVDNFMLEHNYNFNIIEIFKTGSMVLKKVSPKDFDIVVIVDNLLEELSRYHIRQKTIIDNVNYDILFIDKRGAEKRLNFEYNTDYEKNFLLHNYFYAFREIEFGNSGIVFNMFLEKQKYLNIVKEIYSSSIGRAISKKYMGKFFVHYYVILKFYEHNNTIITDDMVKDINLLYSKSIEAEDLINQIDIKIRVI